MDGGIITRTETAITFSWRCDASAIHLQIWTPIHESRNISKPEYRNNHIPLYKGQQALKYSYISSRPGFRQKISAEVWAPTIRHALDILRSAIFVSAPRQILFHVGTNDLDACETEEIRENFCVFFQETSGIVPATQLYASENLPREGMENKVLHVNVELERIAHQYRTILLRHSLNINSPMLHDDRHLNSEGFFIMLSNIRFYMFGILKLKRYHKKRHSKRP